MKLPVPMDKLSNITYNDKDTNYNLRWDRNAKTWYLENKSQSIACGNADTSVSQMMQNMFEYSHPRVKGTIIAKFDDKSDEINVIQATVKQFEDFLNVKSITHDSFKKLVPFALLDDNE